MDKFSKWTGLAHAALIMHYPKFKRGQARECLAAWLGHRTYASLRMHDLRILNKGVKHAIIDAQAAMERANGFGFPITREQWRSVEWALTPSGVSGMWLTEMQSMESAARLAFEDNSHPDANAIAQAIGTTDGHWGENVLDWGEKVVGHSPIDRFPKQLSFTVHGTVRATKDEDFLATPVLAEVSFQRVGARLYLEGQVQSVTRNGEPYRYESEFEFEDYSGGGNYDR
jgi:hypothetical protein